MITVGYAMKDAQRLASSDCGVLPRFKRREPSWVGHPPASDAQAAR